MNRAEFMEELEMLLGCIPKEERNEALEYYEAYFEDAGEEKESEVIKELKSPKKVAESIKAGLQGEDRAIYTERGYEEEKEQNEKHHISLKKEPVSSEKIFLEKENTEKEKHNYVIAIVIAVITSPIWGSVLLAVLAVILGLFGGIIGVIAGLFSMTFALLACGIAGVLYGVVTLTSMISLGLLDIGIGLLCIGIGGIWLWVDILLVTRAIPSFLKWITKKIKKVFHREGDHVS